MIDDMEDAFEKLFKTDSGNVCNECQWTNMGCLNLGNTDSPYWLCHNCIKKIRNNYMDLIYAVSRKFPGESRHQTALRYIMEIEGTAHYNAAAAFEK
jgi:hypothetical protein